MKENTITIVLLILVFGFGFYFYLFPPQDTPSEANSGGQSATSPIDAVYEIEGTQIKLVHGLYEEETTYGSSSRTTVRVWGEPVYGDMDNDTDEDSAVYLLYSNKGGGVFYYLAVARNVSGKYTGVNTIFLGDRISPQNIRIEHGIVIANYADRDENESINEKPSIGKSLYAYIKDGKLVRIFLSGKNEGLYFGNLVYGHEARTFAICSGGEYWIVGTNEFLAYIKELYESLTIGSAPYTPVFMVVTGGIVSAPEDGFGADYDYGFSIKEIIKATTADACR